MSKKSGMEIPDSPSQKLRENPLSFSPVQYPLDLGSNELGHYIMFESGFVGYSPQTSGFLEMSKDRGGHPLHRSRKLTSKLPDRFDVLIFIFSFSK